MTLSLFCDASREQLLYIRMELIFSEAIIGLKVNVGKNDIVPKGELRNLNVLARVLCCKVGSLPMIYLGMPLGAHYKDSSIWNPIIEKMERRLSGWKRLYFLSLFTIPQAMAGRLEMIQRNFLWRASEKVFKYPLVAWEDVCMLVEVGQLGVRRNGLFNQALLRKWLWRFGKESNRLWL